MLDEAKTYLDTQEYKKAQSILVPLATANPDDAEINFYTASSFDALGLEKGAIPYYQASLANGLKSELRQRAYVQLGSSLRCIGNYNEALAILQEGLTEFPNNAAIKTFLAITQYNLNTHQNSTQLLLNLLVETSSDEWIQNYKRALGFYAEHLDETWETE
ncbi:tetratricopeptide repeat protein [Alkalicoccobacillus murimartini]|uniref:Tetratricopeptide (TPR) repeat protein n=1 Tax=Alkalicoccobacillus murimartini TaxID=171685 RepID=A0ABT9YKI4_9BACI|nr:tetratricopeptide repeat protein [Alkalicoccobacillus murimartini]MDQ0208384.1 tetratricopeptide (TPR) repeat protein [Alkalicoccobacillus murimartini]